MIEISKKELEDLYWNNTNEYAAEKLGVSQVTLLRYIDEAGIEHKGKGCGMATDCRRKVRII
jgi:predicted DNA-binding protein (UPF0251 family)